MKEFLEIAETININPVDLDHFISDYYNRDISVDDNIKNLILFITI
jgi:hypothetical protein